MQSGKLTEDQERILDEIIPVIVSRQEWSARKAKKKRQLKRPVNTILFTATKTNPCYSKEHCTYEVKKIQEQHMDELDQPDIQYNFLIGRDGSVFEGRGWTYAPSKIEEKGAEQLNENSIQIAFIGHGLAKPGPGQLRSAMGLLAMGIRKNYILENVGIYQHGLEEDVLPFMFGDQEQMTEEENEEADLDDEIIRLREENNEDYEIALKESADYDKKIMDRFGFN